MMQCGMEEAWGFYEVDTGHIKGIWKGKAMNGSLSELNVWAE